ncbi:MAG TPA: FGGY family carbohydrate kinase, partial [Puia sp.]|nr:FGGY family carbohydrate kinase [Puia sp.]
MPTPVIAIFDIGKTNKKLFLFDEDYRIVFENSESLPEIKDEDGEACEDLQKLEDFIRQSVEKIFSKKEFDVRAINFSAYGASLVYIDEKGNPLTPLYNYLKKYPAPLQKKFYDQYGGEKKFSLETASPVLGSLNSGMQLYRIKHE